MLVLARKKNQVIKIGDDITLVVVRIERDVVKIGVEAPRGVAVDRQEVRTAREQEVAGRSLPAGYYWHPGRCPDCRRRTVAAGEVGGVVTYACPARGDGRHPG